MKRVGIFGRFAYWVFGALGVSDQLFVSVKSWGRRVDRRPSSLNVKSDCWGR